MRVLIFANTSWNLINFRSGLIKAMVAQGYEVIAVAPEDKYTAQLKTLGCRYLPMPMDNKGTNPVGDILLLVRFYFLLRTVRPDIFLGYTVKPNIFGSIAAHALQIPVINNVAGLGSVFAKEGWLNQLVRGLYRHAFSRSAKVFFQNDDDLKLFVLSGLVQEAVVDRLPGSGVDLKKYTRTALPGKTVVRFLLIARMLWEKGVGVYVDAARILQSRGIDAECCLMGFLDVQNPSAISKMQMDEWMAEGVVSYLGASDYVDEEIDRADCVVLPSYYREGTPRVLLEAAAMARPIVTTDSVGCRDVVDDGVNGYLCKPKNAVDLADKMEHIVSMLPAEREVMGLRGREKVERQFDEKIVIRKYLEAIEIVISKR